VCPVAQSGTRVRPQTNNNCNSCEPATGRGTVLRAFNRSRTPTAMYNRVDTGSRTLRTCYATKHADVNAWLDKHFPPTRHSTAVGGSYQVMGVDVEWRSDALPNRMALLQLADVGGNVLLFHVHHSRKEVPASLDRVLRSPGVLKVGVGVLEDVKKIQERWPVPVAGVVDLDELERLEEWFSRCPQPHHRRSLAAFAEHYVHVPSWKQSNIAISNWEAQPLTLEQEAYAAMDAWAGAAIFEHMRPHQAVVDHMVWSRLPAPPRSPLK